ncbi:hypothetical protein DY000_02036235 [Brassica cretica]|uniref:Uncharacterized protein n=1 Tax=Brassica cretica TaxID=69181 RepID=A0ABQ7B8E4_BRACR|nr:hypothetical protein DY000_02036235 [Brassica cretica]
MKRSCASFHNVLGLISTYGSGFTPTRNRNRNPTRFQSRHRTTNRSGGIRIIRTRFHIPLRSTTARTIQFPRRTHTRPRLPPRALNPRVSEGNKNLVGRNKALVHVVGKDYAAAVREYEECIERDSSDVVAVNNKALCLMYLRDLSGDGECVGESAGRGFEYLDYTCCSR